MDADTQPVRHIVSIRYETYFYISGRLSHAYRRILYSDGSIDFAALSANQYRAAVHEDATANERGTANPLHARTNRRKREGLK